MSAVKSVLDFLFGKSKKGPELDTSTRINSRAFFSTLTYYRILDEEFECQAAKSVANILERLSIATNGEGRKEGTAILMQDLPKEQVLLRGISEAVKQTGGD